MQVSTYMGFLGYPEYNVTYAFKVFARLSGGSSCFFSCIYFIGKGSFRKFILIHKF